MIRLILLFFFFCSYLVNRSKSLFIFLENFAFIGYTSDDLKYYI